ncbi:GAF domain-containing protein [uncultured Alsobacter sp.]|uniref:GAF domain-containing protein n=1 Tax=uncultured Alsobacter sp. TaxID=1748258 RepID=UPI0025ED176D|nr:GAF domain-containing protein [uncultured Alsobacter sp.]
MGTNPIPRTANLSVMQALVGARRLGAAALDHIAQVARERFKVPAAVVSLSDGQQLFFAGRSGVGLGHTLLEGSFCSTTLATGDVLVVEDAVKDPRFAENCLVIGEPHVRFYAGAPIVLQSGEHIGAMCVLDVEPRPFNVGQRVVLKHMALAAKAELERLCASDPAYARPN